MISAKFLWGNVLLGGKQQIDTKNSNFEFFESPLYMISVSMPLTQVQLKHSSMFFADQSITYLGLVHKPTFCKNDNL